MYYKVKLLLLTRLQYVFKTFSKRIQHIFEIYSEEDWLQKDLLSPHFWETYGQGTNFPRADSLNISNLLKQLFKNFLKRLLLQMKISSSMLGIRKDVPALANKEKMNISSLRNVYFMF